MTFQVNRIVQLQTDAVARWHIQPFDNPNEGWLRLICQQHEANFRLWHQEDIARSPSATDNQLADVKRSIDQLNQRRNDLIEAVDDELAQQLAHIQPATDATLNTETPGSAIDRLSIMALRLFHYEEQFARTDIDDDFRHTMQGRINVCRQQQTDLSTSLQDLADDLFAGRKRHRTYRQLKMYNDPSLNPAIYDADS